MLRALAAVACVMSFARAGSGAMELTAANFDGIVGSKSSFVMFKAPWCGAFFHALRKPRPPRPPRPPRQAHARARPLQAARSDVG